MRLSLAFSASSSHFGADHRGARRGRRGCGDKRAAEDPKVFTRIHFRFVVTGRGLAPAHVERAIRLSKEKYCSATAMLAKTAQITTDFEIREGEGPQT